MTHRYFNHWMQSAKSTGSKIEPKEIRYLSKKWPSKPFSAVCYWLMTNDQQNDPGDQQACY